MLFRRPRTGNQKPKGLSWQLLKTSTRHAQHTGCGSPGQDGPAREIEDCLIDGPLAYGQCDQPGRGTRKHIVQRCCGDADILLVPDIEPATSWSRH